MVSIKKLVRVDKKTLDSLNELLLQWKKNYQISPRYFKELIANSHVVCLYDNDKIIGSVTLVKMHKLSGLKGSIEHLIVDEQYRGRGFGKKIMKYAIILAKKLKMESLFLTANPDRKIANHLYKKLGFKREKTNFYHLDLPS